MMMLFECLHCGNWWYGDDYDHSLECPYCGNSDLKDIYAQEDDE